MSCFLLHCSRWYAIVYSCTYVHIYINQGAIVDEVYPPYGTHADCIFEMLFGSTLTSATGSTLIEKIWKLYAYKALVYIMLHTVRHTLLVIANTALVDNGVVYFPRRRQSTDILVYVFETPHPAFMVRRLNGWCGQGQLLVIFHLSAYKPYHRREEKYRLWKMYRSL